MSATIFHSDWECKWQPSCESSCDPARHLDKFHRFPYLPLEIREEIYKSHFRFTAPVDMLETGPISTAKIEGAIHIPHSSAYLVRSWTSQIAPKLLNSSPYLAIEALPVALKTNLFGIPHDMVLMPLSDYISSQRCSAMVESTPEQELSQDLFDKVSRLEVSIASGYNDKTRC